jgi:uncharacterized protein YceH (UPF0502 family)
VARLPRRPGTKESRYTHLLGQPFAAAPETPPASDRLERLEAQVEALAREVADVRRQLADFRKQFE